MSSCDSDAVASASTSSVITMGEFAAMMAGFFEDGEFEASPLDSSRRFRESSSAPPSKLSVRSAACAARTPQSAFSSASRARHISPTFLPASAKVSVGFSRRKMGRVSLLKNRNGFFFPDSFFFTRDPSEI